MLPAQRIRNDNQADLKEFIVYIPQKELDNLKDLLMPGKVIVII
jgi:hypothetical protein